MKARGVGYLLAIGVTAAAALLRWVFPNVLESTPFLAFYPAVVVAAAFGGLGPGLLATGLSILCVGVLFDAKPGWAHFYDPLVLGRLAIFLSASVGISMVAGMQRAGRERERRQAADRIESERKYRIVADNTHDWEFWLGPDGRFLYNSPSCLAVTGYTVEAFLADPDLLEHIVHPDDRPLYETHRGLDPHVCATPEAEFRIIRRDGAIRWIGHNCRPIYDAEGRFLGIRGSNRDITARKQAEEALRASERRFRTLADALPIMIWQSQADRGCDYFNRGWLEFTGQSLEQELGDGWAKHLHPDDAQRVLEVYTAAFDRHEPFAMEYRLRHRSGEYRWILDPGVPRFDPDGQFLGFIGGCIDIQERKLAEAALRETSLRLRTHIENTPLAVIEWDRQFRVTRWTGEAEHLFGWSEAEALGKGPSDLGFVHEDDRPEIAETIAAMLRGDSLRNTVASRNRRKDGKVVHCEWYNSVLPDGQGRGGSILSLVLDVTRRKEDEAQLRLQAAALEAAANGIAITDAQGAILWANPAFGAITGYTLKEVLGQTHRILKSGQQDGPFYRNLWVTIRSGKVWRGELVNRRKDGTLYDEEMTITPLPDGQGGISHFIAIKQEITARKRAEAAAASAKLSAETAKAIAEDANAAKDHFLAVLSHELRTPLTPVLAAVAMLQDVPDLAPSTREALEMIRRNVEMEARLIDDLLDVTRIAKGKVELKRKPVDLCAVIRRAIDVCKPDIEARGLHFAVDWSDEGPQWVEADAARLQQVFWNVLRNAIKFSSEGGHIVMRCRRVGNQALVEVVDSGIGMEPEVQERIFNAFEQAERSITRQFGGLGLGLSISKALVEMHGGTIEAHSEGRGRGATFRIGLPLAAPAAQNDGQAGAVPGPRVIRPLRILLVEDHGDTARIMQKLLTLNGHTARVAGDVATALHLTESESFDLLLSDLGLPDGSGIDLIRELRRRGLAMPAIAVSGYGQDQDIHRTKEAGFAAHLTKPTSPDRLIEAIGELAQHW